LGKKTTVGDLLNQYMDGKGVKEEFKSILDEVFALIPKINEVSIFNH
jgi:hypothetical protein